MPPRAPVRWRILVYMSLTRRDTVLGLFHVMTAAAAEIVSGMWKVKDHYNLNRLSLVAAEAALEDIDTMRCNAARICRTRERLCKRLTELGFFVWDSQANFVLARLGEDLAGYAAATLYEQLKERRILVRYFDDPPRLSNCLRISIGTDTEIDTLLTALEELISI